MKNIFLKISGLFIIILCVIILTGCGNQPSKELWNKYVKAVNKGDLNGVAECFTEPDTVERTNFTIDHADYLTNLKSIKTKSYKETINCSFSNSMNTQAYYLAEIEAVVNGSTTYTFSIYMYENNKGLFFCSSFNFEDGFTGNEPSAYWKQYAYYHTDEFLYKNYDTGTVYIEETKNLKSVTVPAEVDGQKVSTIGEYAFYKYYKILSFTIPTSKLKELIIEEGVNTIGKYAFYQCKKLKSLVIPESMRYIDRMAFANCAKLEKLEFQVRTKESGSVIELNSESIGATDTGEKLVITGGHNLLTGEILYLNAELGDNKVPRVLWSSSSEVLSINSSTGKVTANKAGHATVVATLIDNPAVTARIEIDINEIETKDCLKMYWDAFSRCKNLKEIYIHAYNPNSIIIDGGNTWLFNSTCKIYVPKGARDMYVSHTLWSKYADQIVEMQEDDAELTIDTALNAVNLTRATSGDIYSAVNPNKIDNIIYLIQNGTNYNLVNAYVGSKLLNNANANVISETTSKEQLYNLLSGLMSELSITLDDDILEKEIDEDSDDGKLYADALALVMQFTSQAKDNINLTRVEFVENELNPGVKLYSINYKIKDSAEATVEVLNVYINGESVQSFDVNYDSLYALIKIVMASANKVEK